MFPSWVPLTAVLAYYAVTFFLRSWVQYRRTGINPFTLLRDREDTLYRFAGRWMSLTSVLIIAEAAAWSINRPLTHLLFHPTATTARAGAVLMAAGTAITLAAQAHMADAWRIGIDNQHKTPLVTTGLFRYSRNPVFVSMLLALAGLVALVPTYLMAGALVVSIVVIGVQVRLEEAFLLEQHGEPYRTYLRQVRRYL